MERIKAESELKRLVELYTAACETVLIAKQANDITAYENAIEQVDRLDEVCREFYAFHFEEYK